MTSIHKEAEEFVAAAEHDFFFVTCSSRLLLARLADKWVTLVLCALTEGPPGSLDSHEGSLG